ncbi:MAG: hypothetical protein ACKOGA_20740, partial [Planctomycetaceae bacterium]
NDCDCDCCHCHYYCCCCVAAASVNQTTMTPEIRSLPSRDLVTQAASTRPLAFQKLLWVVDRPTS